MSSASETEILRLNQRLLASIVASDWATYAELCDESLTAFEPEGRGQLIEGLPFHKFYFELGGASGPRHTTMAAARVRMLGENAAVLTYTRLTQKLDAAGAPVTVPVEETRIWERRDGRWRHVHFHRSSPS